ncbi:LysR family transcriptional regulator [Chelativorans salis]|uniref:LysR family transcriptional regulator n=1 Tax=Chelativorans salis TaxID=2978478 RepID=A0ABT2LIP7_9HYPH|nr:LysR family transcriptional regulator [Chelativorans sp. EGI FJ00035]MCT7374450.1 LysR family transcriptional regulator [Chelativorans sp. EGI FJ00035]
MTQRLPNLNAVRAFDAAARHQSFTRAADELGVTHASISRYVKNLEAQLGVTLFERRHRQVVLTPAGARYADVVSDALALISIETGTRATRNVKGKVVVEIDSDLAVLWLMPLLDNEVLDGLGIELELRSYPEPPRTIAPDTDLAITWGPMNVPGFSRELFLSFTMFPVCAPQREEHVRMHGLAANKLIYDRGVSTWDQFLKRAGTGLDAAEGHLIFHRTHLCMEAAARGLGVAVGDDVTAAAMLREGRLVRPFGPSMPGRQSYHLSTASRGPVRPPVAALRSWLLEQAADHVRWAREAGLSPPLEK